jgi:hypothetical protein
MELPNGKGGKKKAASKQQRTASPAAPAPEGGSLVEGEMAEELLAVPGPSGMCAGSSGSVLPAPIENSAAAVEPAVVEPTAMKPPLVELVISELSPAAPVIGPGRVQPDVSVSELAGMELSVPAAQAAAAASAAETAMTVRRVSEALSVLALELAADGEPAAGVPEGVPAAVEPAAATLAASAAEPAGVEGERPVLANGPAAASKECWVAKPCWTQSDTEEILGRADGGGGGDRCLMCEVCWRACARVGDHPAARQAAWGAESPPTVTTSGPIPPKAAAASVKRKARAGVTGGSQKRKKSSPAEAKDL